MDKDGGDNEELFIRKEGNKAGDERNSENQILKIILVKTAQRK